MAFRFRKKERLKRRDRIGAVFKEGKVFSCSGLKLFVLANGLPHNRLAVTFSRKFGNAAARNRARRVSREAYRHISSRLKAGYDLVVLVYPGNDRFAARLEQLETLFLRARLISGSIME